MTDQYLATMMDSTRNLSFDTTTLLSNSTINALHFPGLSTSGMSDSGGGRTMSFLLDGIGMCESMTESFCSNGGQDDPISNTNGNTLSSDTSMCQQFKMDRKDSTTQKKRRSRKAQFDASVDGTSLDKIEVVNLIDEKTEPDDAWLFEVPKDEHHDARTKDNIFSWVHKEFQTNDIHANKHRLLCKLDDMSHARTIRSVSCHNFLNSQRSDSVERDFLGQPVNSELVKSGRLSSPLRAKNLLLNGTEHTHANQSPFRSTLPAANTNGNHTSSNITATTVRSREVSKERENQHMDYTDLEVMAKLQLENLRQAERQGPLSKRFGGSSLSLASTSSGTSVLITNRSGTKPPVAPKPTLIKNGVKTNTYRRSNTQTLVSNTHDVPVVSDPKPSVTMATRVSLLPPNSANNNRTRPPIARPIQPYRGSQTTFHNGAKTQVAPSSAPRTGKNSAHDFASTFTTKDFSTNENGLLNDVSNKPLMAPLRSQVGSQRRTIVPQSSTHSSVEQIPPTSSTDGQTTTIPRSSSSHLSQGRKSGIPMIGKQQKPGPATVTRLTSSQAIPSSQSSDNVMVTRTLRTPGSIARPQISNPTSLWNDGCY